MTGPIPLSPLGAARERFLAGHGRVVEPAPGRPVLPARIVEAARSRDSGVEALQLAWELARCAPSLDPVEQRSLALLALAVLVARADGSTRVSLAPAAFGERLLGLGARHPEVDASLRLVATALAGGPGTEVIGRAGEYKPLIRVGDHLYAQRLLRLEDRVVEAIRERLRACGGGPAHGDIEMLSAKERRGRRAGCGSGLAADAPGGAAGALAEILARPPVPQGPKGQASSGPIVLSDEQQRAVLAAVERPLAVISGGPGTGKTSIVVSILRLLLRLGVPAEAIALAAPTGKAANRMDGSIRAYLQAIPDPAPPDASLLAVRPEPRTLHRLLGYSPSTGRFRHHEGNPLAQRVVIVDEASMIDLFVIERLIRAVRLDAHLVLLGDADQLPSVEAGAVFRDLLPPETNETKNHPGRSEGPEFEGRSKARRPLSSDGSALGRGSGGKDLGGTGGDPRASAAVRLTQSFRMDPTRPEGRAILTVARAIQAGRLDDVRGPPTGAAGEVRIESRATAAEVRFEGVEHLEGGGAARHTLLERWFEKHAGAVPDLQRRWRHIYRRAAEGFTADDRRELDLAFRHHESFRILCLARGHAGGTGAQAVNETLHRFAGAQGPDPIPGEPVLVRRNDYERGLFNGDQGLVLRVSDGGPPRTMVVFPVSGGYEAFPLDVMRADLDLAWAMTVHRSQGSEFDRVLVLLPDEDGPLLTRELLYTAATRARTSVVLVGSAELIELAAARPIRRDSGIGERLAAPQGRPS